MLDVDRLLPVADNTFANPLATPPPDDVDFPISRAALPVFLAAAAAAAAVAPRPRLSLDIVGPRSDSDAQHAALAYDAQQVSGLSASSPHAQSFRYARASLDSSSVSAASGGDGSIYSSASAFEHCSDAATSATSVTGYPSSPPPSRQHSDHGCGREKLSGTNQFPPQSPAASSVGQPATSHPERLNMPFQTSLNTQNLPEHYPPPFGHSQHPLQNPPQRQLGHPQHQSHSHSHSQSSSSSLHSPSDRFPPLASMLASDRYQRPERYSFPPPDHERRLSDSSDHYSTAKHYAPQSLSLGPVYATPSYTLHRVNRSGSFSDLGPESGYSRADWQEERDRLYREERSGIGPYSPIHSSFSSSNSSIATPGHTSPHSASYYHPQDSRGYPGHPGGYALYGSPEDVSYDRPQSSSGESNSPPYAHASVSGSTGYSGSKPTLPHQTAYSNGNDPASKTYSFVSLPGNTVRKRPRRRYDEIERLYACNFSGCTKAYGTLNHLNAHVNMQKHGLKRHPNEFKEMRKQWRKMKKEQEQERERNSLPQGDSLTSENSPSMTGNGTLTEVMRRRRTTEPNPYGLHPVSHDDDITANAYAPVSGSVVTSVSDPLDMQSLAVSSYGLSPGMPMNVPMDSMGGSAVGGYGHHHYVHSPVYHSQRRTGLSPVSPVSPTSPSDAYGGPYLSNGGVLAPLSLSSNTPGSNTAYYDEIAHVQQGGYEHERERTSPPRNQLPPDATLCSAYSHQSQHSEMGGDGYGLPSLSSIVRIGHHGHLTPQ